VLPRDGAFLPSRFDWSCNLPRSRVWTARGVRLGAYLYLAVAYIGDNHELLRLFTNREFGLDLTITT
jgi:hypothetical protein